MPDPSLDVYIAVAPDRRADEAALVAALLARGLVVQQPIAPEVPVPTDAAGVPLRATESRAIVLLDGAAPTPHARPLVEYARATGRPIVRVRPPGKRRWPWFGTGVLATPPEGMAPVAASVARVVEGEPLAGGRGWRFVGGLVAVVASGALVVAAVYDRAPDTPVPPPGPRLVSVGGVLYLRGVDSGAKRGALYVVRDPKPLPGGADHRKLGVVQLLEHQGGRTSRAGWYLGPDAAPPIDAVGFPAEPVREDTELRLGKWWTRHAPDPEAHAVRLAIGRGDGVAAGDVYALLGAPRADEVNRTVDSFERLTTCTVAAAGLELSRARCAIDDSTAARPTPGYAKWSGPAAGGGP